MVNTSGGSKSKSRAEVEREKILAQLDAADQEVPQNPGLFTSAGNGEDFKALFEKSLGDRDFKIGDVVKIQGKNVKISAIHADGTFDGDEVK